jgi:hypothetical protein
MTRQFGCSDAHFKHYQTGRAHFDGSPFGATNPAKPTPPVALSFDAVILKGPRSSWAEGSMQLVAGELRPQGSA